MPLDVNDTRVKEAIAQYSGSVNKLLKEILRTYPRSVFLQEFEALDFFSSIPDPTDEQIHYRGLAAFQFLSAAITMYPEIKRWTTHGAYVQSKNNLEAVATQLTDEGLNKDAT